MATRSVSSLRKVVRDFGYSLSFSGSNNYVSCGSDASLQVSNAFTISFRFKIGNVSQTQQWLFKKTGSGGNTSYAVLYNYNTGYLEFYATGYTGTNPGYSSSISRIFIGKSTEWNHVSLSYDGNSWIGVLNGELVFTNTITFSLNSGSGSLILGCSAVGSNQFYGKLNEFMLYNVGYPLDTLRRIYLEGYIPSSDNLKLYYKFNEGSGSSLIDYSGNNNTGTITGATYSSDVYMKARTVATTRMTVRDFNSALQNPKTNCGIDSSFNFERTSPFSVSAWILAGGTAVKVIFDHQRYTAPYTGYAFAINASGKLYVQLINSYGGNNYIDVSGNISIVNGQWHHCVFTYDGSSTAAGCKFYVDRVLNTNTVTKDTLSASMQYDATLYIGHNNNLSNLTGYINDVQLYTKELSQSEINDIYYKGYADVAAFVNWWKLNEGTGLTAYDYRGSFNQTITGGTWVSSKGYISARS